MLPLARQFGRPFVPRLQPGVALRGAAPVSQRSPQQGSRELSAFTSRIRWPPGTQQLRFFTVAGPEGGSRGGVKRGGAETVSCPEATSADFATRLESCRSSEQMRRLMKTASLRPDEATYNTLVRALMIEGNRAAAQAVIETEMVEAGVTPDQGTRDVLTLSDDELSRRRTKRLGGWLAQGTRRRRGGCCTGC